MASEDLAYGRGRPESFISNEPADEPQHPIPRKPLPGAEGRDSHESKPFIDVNISGSPDSTLDPGVTKEVPASTEYSNYGKCGLARPLYQLAGVALSPRVHFTTSLPGPIN
jgi:hypothetical protein